MQEPIYDRYLESLEDAMTEDERSAALEREIDNAEARWEEQRDRELDEGK